MADDIKINQTFDPNRPRLKKVKRPVRRMVPQQSGDLVSPFVHESENKEIATINQDNQHFKVDAYIDDLPSKNKLNNNIQDSQPNFISEAELEDEYGFRKNELPDFLTKF